MQRVIPITINIKTGTTDSQIMMYRGDNVKFQFNFTDTSSVSLDTATKLRVSVKPANDLKANYVWFSGEATITAEDYSIEFTSEQTSGYAGNGFLAVLVLDANNETVCTAGIPFRVEPSGYDGIYTPSEDFRDEVFAARDAAIAAKNEAVSAASSAQESLSTGENLYQQGLQEGNAILADCNSAKAAAESSAQSAEMSAGIAAQHANDAESAKNAAVAAKNTATTQAELASASATNAAQSATTAQQAAAQAVEITDPEGWRTDTRKMIARLALTKSNSGTLYFSGGSASATPNLAFDTLSVLFKTDFDFSSTDNIYPFYLGDTNNAFYVISSASSIGISVRPYNAIGDFSRNAIKTLVSEGLNTFAFVFKKLADGNAQVSLFVNGVSVPNRSTKTAEYPTLPSNILLNRSQSNITAGTVGYSDFRIFNFDVSATDAPYTLADYQAGKRLPPFLSSGVYIKSNPNVDTQKTPPAGKLGGTTQGTLAKSNNGYTLTLTSSSTRRFWFKFDKKYPAGTWFRVRRGALTWDGMETTGGRISQASLNVGTSTTSPYTVAVSNLPTSKAVDVVFQTPIEANMVGFIVWNGADVSTATVSIPYFEFEVLGAIVALENYTIARNATTKLIKDASGNGNDATVSGNVAGDMDTGITVFVDELKTQISQQSTNS